MDPADLEVFAAVARHGSMRAAAEALNTVQSNVTARIRVLEDEIGAALFERHSRGVVLTAAGRRLLPYVGRVTSLLRDAAAAARDDGTPKGPLLLGALETTLALRLSPLLSSYARAFPEVDLTLRTGTTAELIDKVLGREVEGAFVCGPVDHPDLVEEVVFREELAILTAPDVTRLDAALARSGLKIVVLRMGCSYRQRLEGLLARRGIVGLRILEFGTLEAIFGCVSAGLGLTLLPRALLGPVWPAARVHVHALAPAEASVETAFVRRRDGHVSSALAAFLDHVRARTTRAIAAE
ncbi:MAG: LysR family transcriptional regulator [Rhodoplanes sp.]|uniref:LysR family transcriptional regulator n=1 Tax=Rhodoplanes sp. TaxID=1968906 RepID=UPI0017C3156C|nr:LysR family transcriptional regulator [Rhodoplanes sp.]NVO18038.1 LysR family transcriptional regulator [Rhodoplanes sp.]